MAAHGALNVARRKLGAVLRQVRHLAVADDLARVRAVGQIQSEPGRCQRGNERRRELFTRAVPVHAAAQHHGHAGHVAAAGHALDRRADRGTDRRQARPTSICCCSSRRAWRRPCRGAIAFRRCTSRMRDCRLRPRPGAPGRHPFGPGRSDHRASAKTALAQARPRQGSMAATPRRPVAIDTTPVGAERAAGLDGYPPDLR